jgi:hypothetical protein
VVQQREERRVGPPRSSGPPQYAHAQLRPGGEVPTVEVATVDQQRY